MIKEGGTTAEERIAFAFRLATGRRPDDGRDADILPALRFSDASNRLSSPEDARQSISTLGEYPRDREARRQGAGGLHERRQLDHESRRNHHEGVVVWNQHSIRTRV